MVKQAKGLLPKFQLGITNYYFITLLLINYQIIISLNYYFIAATLS